jgi:hypothetical protein
MTSAIDYLISAQHESGGWGYSSTQKPVVEPTSAVLLAIRDEPQAYEAYLRGISWLVNSQHQDGGWGINQDDPESGWQTAWALISLKHTYKNNEVVMKGIDWLTSIGTSEITREEFQASEFPENNNITAYSWPWLPDQVGYIEPTAMAVLALDGLADSQLAKYRISAALQYFRQNRSPTGGWDTGNAGPLDTVILPRAYTSALVLMALAHSAQQDIQLKDLTALQQAMQGDTSILAQSSGLVALQIIGKNDETIFLKIVKQQRTDGSWNANPFFTAWAFMALRGYFT